MKVARIHFKGFKATGNCQRKVCHMRVIQEINHAPIQENSPGSMIFPTGINAIN